jgi:hypothetical protein
MVCSARSTSVEMTDWYWKMAFCLLTGESTEFPSDSSFGVEL